MEDLDKSLHFAAQFGDVELVRKLLAESRSPNEFDELAKTPLHYAAEEGRVEIMQLLIDAGADVNARDESRIGNTPLRSVAENCSLEVAKLLLDNGADPRIPGWMGITALDQSATRSRGEGPKVHALLKEAASRSR